MAKQARPTARLVVDVIDSGGTPVTDAKLEFRSVRGKGHAAAKLQNSGGSYIAEELFPSRGEISVSHQSLEAQTREVVISSGDNRQLFVLGRPGSKYYFREKVRVPVDAPRNLFAATLTRNARRDRTKLVETLRAFNVHVRQEGSSLAERAGRCCQTNGNLSPVGAGFPTLFALRP